MRLVLKHKVRPHRVEAEISDEVHYKKEKEDEWRGPGQVIGREAGRNVKR